MATVSFSNEFEQVLCSYINQTQRIQVVKIDRHPGWNLERVIFPDQVFLFEAPTIAELDIYVDLAGKTTLLDRIPCSHLNTMTAPAKILELAQ